MGLRTFTEILRVLDSRLSYVPLSGTHSSNIHDFLLDTRVFQVLNEGLYVATRSDPAYSSNVAGETYAMEKTSRSSSVLALFVGDVWPTDYKAHS